MFKTDAKRHFKTLSAIAKALRVTKSAVSQWGEIVPEGAAYKLLAITRGKIPVNPQHYLPRAARRPRRAA
jgi:DNA-binding transcriptional regulator YdaS (Cro superfamily)